jgi:hypothetical protein
MAKSASYAGKKQADKKKSSPADRGKKTRFKKNNPETGEKDPRINRKGRPRSSDELKKFVLDILEEEGTIPETGEKITVLRQMVLGMAIRGAGAEKIHILDRAFGKVPDEVVVSYDDLQKIIDYLPQDMLERLSKGESLGDVIVSLVKARGDGQNGDTEE